jgi:hypothetical protein
VIAATQSWVANGPGTIALDLVQHEQGSPGPCHEFLPFLWCDSYMLYLVYDVSTYHDLSAGSTSCDTDATSIDEKYLVPLTETEI